MEGRYISHSQIACITGCARKYYYRYIERIPTPTTPALLMGSCYHAGIERNFRAKAAHGLDLALDEVLDAYDTAWHARLESDEIDWQDENPGDVKDRGIGLLRTYMETTAPFVMPAEVERRFSVALPGIDGWTLDGIVDLITIDGVIIDHKTGTRSKTQDDADRDLQASAYAFALFTDPTVEEANFEFHVAVAKKVPEIQRVSTVRSRADAEWYLNLVAEYVQQIRAGIFPPNPTGWLCSPTWCGYWDRCRGGAR